MTQIDINLVDEVVNEHELSLANVEYPTCLLGVELKNNYDNCRINCDQFNTIKHNIYNINTSTTKYFRGIHITPTDECKEVVDKLMHIDALPGGNLTLPFYKNLLKNFNLNCDDCYAYFEKGVYPINSDNISKFCKEKIDLNLIYKNIFSNKNSPIYQSVSYLVIYVLTDTKINSF